MIKNIMKRRGSIGSAMVTFFGAMLSVLKSCPPCPMCMPKYSALFAFFGLELANYSHYLIPVMILGMVFSLTSMFYQTYKKELSIYPCIGAFISCGFILIFKFIFHNLTASYFAVAGLFSSVIFHHMVGKKGCCKGCSK